AVCDFHLAPPPTAGGGRAGAILSSYAPLCIQLACGGGGPGGDITDPASARASWGGRRRVDRVHVLLLGVAGPLSCSHRRRTWDTERRVHFAPGQRTTCRAAGACGRHATPPRAVRACRADRGLYCPFLPHRVKLLGP